MKILSFGEIIWDMFPDDKYIGGAIFNFAANLAHEGAESYLLSSVGDDDLAIKALEYVNKYNIKSDFVAKVNNKETGQCIVHFDEIIGPYYTIKDDVSYDYLAFNERLVNEKFDALSFGSLALRHQNNYDLINKLIDSKMYNVIFCDINLRAPYYNDKIVDFCFSKSHILKINDLEFEELINKDKKELKTILNEFSIKYQNIELILLTCGEKGAYAYTTKDKKLYFKEALKVNVVSTVGAGDSFGACFLYNYLLGKSIDECLFKATKRSAEIVSILSAI